MRWNGIIYVSIVLISAVGIATLGLLNDQWNKAMPEAQNLDPIQEVVQEQEESVDLPEQDEDMNEPEIIELDEAIEEPVIEEVEAEPVYEEYYEPYYEPVYQEPVYYEPVYYAPAEDGVLSQSGGVNYYGGNKETYYNLDMSGVIANAQTAGIQGEYAVRGDGVKTYGGYVIVADGMGENYGSIIDTSLGQGIVLDACPAGTTDIATAW